MMSERAVDALHGFSPTWRTLSVPASPGDAVAATAGRWDVVVHSALTTDGQSTVVYRLSPM